MTKLGKMSIFSPRTTIFKINKILLNYWHQFYVVNTQREPEKLQKFHFAYQFNYPLWIGIFKT